MTSMPSQNVEIVRRAHEALNGGDMDTLVVPCDAAFRLDLLDRSFNPAVGLVDRSLVTRKRRRPPRMRSTAA